jgi:hypothetical protein
MEWVSKSRVTTFQVKTVLAGLYGLKNALNGVDVVRPLVNPFGVVVRSLIVFVQTEYKVGWPFHRAMKTVCLM